MKHLTWFDCQQAAHDAAERLQAMIPSSADRISLYGVPRGGIPAAMLIRHALQGTVPHIMLAIDPSEATVIIDDLVDSGATRDRYKKKFPRTPFLPLFDKAVQFGDEWLTFPWEHTDPLKPQANTEDSGHDAFVRLLQFVEEDVGRGGLLETPARAAKAWRFLTSGYGKNPEDVLKVFEDGAGQYDQMVVVRDIPVYSQCEHHLLPFFGTANVAYIPDGKIVGLSKINRLVDIFARRLQVQERLTTQIADAMETHLKPKGVGVVLKCRHMCIESRGVQHSGTATVTSALRGALREDGSARAEFMATANV